MAPSSAIVVKPLAGFVQALSRLGELYQAPKDTIRGITPDAWMSPLQPIRPLGPPGTEPRGFQYYAGQNLIWTPRADAVFTAAQLKQLATYPLARVCVENVKDVLCKMTWEIQAKPKPGESRKQAAERTKGDANIAKLMDFFERPDREHSWDAWCRPLLDDLLVIDAPAVLIRKTYGGEVGELVVLRGESINRYVDVNGLTPLPPDPAYAQNWWGIPLVNLTTDQLLYIPRNIVPRNTVSSQLYGMSPTEQLAPEIEIGIQRLAFVLSYYTEGSVPGLMQVVPRGTPADKIAEAMAWMNSELAGNLAARRQIRLIQGWQEPGKDDQIVMTKEPLLADSYDELHTKRMCFGYGVSPQRLGKTMNRASSEQSDEAAELEGTLPYVVWMKKSLMDNLIQNKFGLKGYEWVPDPFKDPSIEKMAEAVSKIMARPLISPNDGRKMIGEEPTDDPLADKVGYMTPMGWVTLDASEAMTGIERDTPDGKPRKTQVAGVGDDAKPTPGGKADEGAAGGGGAAAKVARVPRRAAARLAEPAARAEADVYGFAAGAEVTFPPTTTGAVTEYTRLAPVSKASAHDTRRAVIHPGRSLPQSVLARHALEKVMINQFREMRKKTVRLLVKALKIRKAAGDDAEEKIRKALDDNWRTIADEVQQGLEDAALAGAAAGALQLEVDDERILSRTNRKAAAYAADRSAELVGMRRTDAGRLVKNPDARWAISDTTREKIRGVIAEVFEKEDVTLTDVETALRAAGVFDDQRATMIAKTEVANAQTWANLLAWKESGQVQQVSWHLSGDHDGDDVCDDNADGSPYTFDEVPEFPAHPNCLCAIVLETLVGEEPA